MFPYGGSEPIRRKGAPPREAVLTPLAFSSHPSTSCGPCPGELTGRRAYGEANPTTAPPSRHVANRSTLNLFGGNDENATPTSHFDTYSFSRKGRANPNVESVSTAEFPSKGIKRVEPPVSTPRSQGVRMVDTNVSSRFRNIAVVGSEASCEFAAEEARQKTTNREVKREPHRPQSASSPVVDCFRMDKTFGADPEAWPVPNSGLKARARPSHDVNRCQRIRLAVCDHVQARHGSLADFFFQLCRGVVGHVGVLPRAPRGQLHIEALRQQLSAAISMTVSEHDIYSILFGALPEEMFDENGYLPETIEFADFTSVFGEGPKSPLLRAHKI